jgi:hypothetical protein
MNCPVCAVELKIYERQGIEVDYCPQCQGVWLDRGELDRIIEAASEEMPTQSAAPLPTYQPQAAPAPRRDKRHEERRYGDEARYEKPRKKRGLLGELFDMFD